jgi:hypothetical protein
MLEEQNKQSPGAAAATTILSFVMLFIELFLLGLIIWQTTYLASQFLRIFDNFGVELPVLTVMLLSLPGKVYGTIAITLGLLLLAKEWTITSQAVKMWINLLGGVGLLAFAVLFHLSLLLPWMSFLASFPE